MTTTAVRRLAAALCLGGGLAVAGYLLFGVSYTSQSQSGSAAAGEAGSSTAVGPVIVTPVQTLHQSGLAFALDQHDWALLIWAGFVLVVSLVAAVSAWTGHSRPIWGAAAVLAALSLLGLMSIGLVIAPQALVLAVAAALVSGRVRLGRQPLSG